MNLLKALLPLRRGGRSVLLLTLVLTAAARGRAQSSPAERAYHASQAEVEKALRDLGAYVGARLPVLEGFVAAPLPPGQYERPYCQFQIELAREAPERTLVRLSAKITAWYADSDPARSEYRALSTNGRLEMDLFERLDERLKKKGVDLPMKPEPSAPAKPPLLDETLPHMRPSANAAASPPATTVANLPASAVEPPLATPAELSEEISRVRSQREAAEKRAAERTAEVKQLEETLRSRGSPSNLSAVTAPRTAIRERPADSARLVFWAEAQDEFEVLEDSSDWKKVGFGADAQGWVRSSHMAPANDSRAPGRSAARQADDRPPFEVTREEVNLFSGEWAGLKGKQALFVWARPAVEIPEGTLGQSQLAYTKKVFAERDREASHSRQSYAGVVVIFLGPRGGVAAATLAQIRRWREGLLPDAEFLKRCSLDPPEAFRDSLKR